MPHGGPEPRWYGRARRTRRRTGSTTKNLSVTSCDRGPANCYFCANSRGRWAAACAIIPTLELHDLEPLPGQVTGFVLALACVVGPFRSARALAAVYPNEMAGAEAFVVGLALHAPTQRRTNTAEVLSAIMAGQIADIAALAEIARAPVPKSVPRSSGPRPSSRQARSDASDMTLLIERILYALALSSSIRSIWDVLSLASCPLQPGQTA